MAIQRKMCEAPDLKFFDGGHGQIEGYASTFHNWDRGQEQVLKGAFTDSIPRFLADGFYAGGHNWDAQPLGFFTDAYEDDHGLYFKAEFHSTPEAQAARTVAMERLASGKTVSTSIGYKVLDSERTKDGVLLKQLDLFEISQVSVPMNPLALVSMVKSGSDGLYTFETIPSLDDDADADQVSGTVWSPPAGLTLADEFALALAALAHALERKQAVMTMRAKAGRVHSASQITAMTDMADSLSAHAATLQGWCADAAPKALTSDTSAARVELARYLLMQAQQLGVPV